MCSMRCLIMYSLPYVDRIHMTHILAFRIRTRSSVLSCLNASENTKYVYFDVSTEAYLLDQKKIGKRPPNDAP